MSDEPESNRASEPAAMKPALGYVWAAINAALGTALLLHVLGLIRLDTRAGPIFLGVIGVALWLVAAYFMFVALANSARAGRAQTSPERAQFERASRFIGWTVLALLAFATTTIAYYAWLPEQAAAFSGGLTGSVWEARFVWGTAALIFDAIGIVAIVLALRLRRR